MTLKRLPDKADAAPQYDQDTLARLDAARRRAREELRQLTEPIRASAQLTADDYAIRINAKA